MKLEPPYVGAHEKRGQDKVSQQRRPENFSLLASQDDHSKVREACVRAVFFGLQFAGSFLRGFTRPCVSVNALRHTWGTRVFFSLSLCFSCPVQGHWGVVGPGDQPATGIITAVHPSRTFGSLLSLPDPLPPPARSQPGGAPHRASRTLPSRWVGPRLREISWGRTLAGSSTAPAGCAGLCAGC